MTSSGRLSYLGHATTLIELDGITLLTDPVLRSRVGPLRRQVPLRVPAKARTPDAVLVSHLHHDHADLPSLRRLDSSTRLIVAAGTGRFFARHGFTAVEELAPGEAAQVGAVTVTAVRAVHDGGRTPLRSSPTVGFLVSGTRDVYFAGDTDLFEEMRELGELGEPDLALLPIWGWGPSLGPGHMDPARAAEAARLIRPRIVVPIHWGTLYPRFLHHLRPRPLIAPPQEFAHELRARRVDAELRVLAPGTWTELDG